MSGEPKDQSTIGHITWRIILASVAVFSLYTLFSSMWSLNDVRLGLHGILGFLAIIGAATVSYEIRKQSITWKYFLLSFFCFNVASIWFINPLYLTEAITEINADLIESVLLGILFLGAIIPTSITQNEIRIRRGLLLVFGMTFVSLFVYGYTYYFVFLNILQINSLIIGMSLGTISIGIFIVIFGILARRSKILQRWDTRTLLTGLILMVISTLILMISYFVSFSLLFASVMFRTAVFYSIFLGISIPVQQEFDISRRKALIYSSIIGLLSVIPYVVSLIVVSAIPVTLVFLDQGIYALTHLVVAFLAAIIFSSLWLYTKQQPYWHRYPLILSFAALTLIEVTIVILSPWVNLTGEYTLLYILGGLMVLIWLSITLRWILHPPTNINHQQMPRWILFFTALMLIVVIAGVFLQSFLFAAFPIVAVQHILRSILLGVCLISLFFLTYLFIIFIQISKGKMNMALIAAGTLAFWVVANIIKSNFAAWTAGWWAAQLFLLFGLLLGPATLGRLYLDTLRQSEHERKRATLYADILVHDLRNYHTAIQSSLDLMNLSEATDTIKQGANEQIQIALDRANRLITNVRSLEKAVSLEPQDLTSIDLVAVIKEAWDHSQINKESDLRFSINRKIGECFVKANKLLLEVFINLFRNALQYSKEIKRVEVEISSLDLNGNQFWVIRIADWGQGIAPEQQSGLFSRYSTSAYGLGLGLSVVKSLVDAFGGTVSIENRVHDDYSQGTVVIIHLLMSEA